MTHPHQPRVRVAVVLPQNDRLLLVRHRKGENRYWLLPGGGLDFGETIEECAKREVREETGLEITTSQMLYISEAICPQGTRHIINIYLLGEIIGGSLEKGAEEVLDGVAFVPFEELPSLTLYPPIQETLLNSWRDGFKAPLAYLGQIWE